MPQAAPSASSESRSVLGFEGETHGLAFIHVRGIGDLVEMPLGALEQVISAWSPAWRR
jgi:hypothetical protein